jgi:hypothetical protein
MTATDLALKRLTEKQLNKLTEKEKETLRDSYVDQLDEASDNYLLTKWTICLLIKDTFGDNKKYMGQYLADLRRKRPNAEICRINESTFLHYYKAAEFCLRYSIDDVYHCGIGPSSIYLLCQKNNEAVCDKVYHKVKNKSLPFAAIAQIIEQEKCVSTIYRQPEPEPAAIEVMPTPTPKLLITVQNNIAQEPLPLYPELERDDTGACFDELDNIITAIDDHYTGPRLVSDNRSGHDRREGELPEAAQVTLDAIDDGDLIIELASRQAYALPDDEILTEIRLVFERYGKSPIKTIPLLQQWIEMEKDCIYTRKTG